MFDLNLLPGSAQLRALDDAGLMDSIIDATRVDSAVQARRVIAIGELWDRRKRATSREEEFFVLDAFEEFAAEVGAAVALTRGRAAGLIRIAEALHDRLPSVAACYERGDIDSSLVSSIVHRTELIDDEDRMAQIDGALADRAPGWMAMSRNKIDELVDSWVARIDPAGVRTPGKREHKRFVDIRPTYAGMAGIWGAVSVPDAIVLDERLDQLLATVCPHDPRATSELRADAMRALAERADRMPCKCGIPDCQGEPAKPADTVVLHVLAESDTVDGNNEHHGYAVGFGPVNAHTVRELAATARQKPVIIPKDAKPEPRYRPSPAVGEFVRLRDLTCRFPGCDCPAEYADIDHTVPYEISGVTHPSGLKVYCRRHHLLKTFYGGPNGWNDRQLADGTVIFTAPTGHTYITKPGGSLFFPALAVPTGEPPPPPPVRETHPNRCAMMPKRKRTRAEERAYRLALERRHNTERIGHTEFLPAQRVPRRDDPPPF
jgi:hypothetical protein